MKILTGKDRKDYETALFLNGQNAAKVMGLQDQVKWLEKEVSKLTTSLEREKERADQAVDRLLVQKGIPSVTPLPKNEDAVNLFEEDLGEMTKLRSRIEREGITAVMEATHE